MAKEAADLERVLSACISAEVVVRAGAIHPPSSTSRKESSLGDVDALRLRDDNRNGRITCAKARRHGIAPVSRGDPAYPFMHDVDSDGVVCE